MRCNAKRDEDFWRSKIWQVDGRARTAQNGQQDNSKCPSPSILHREYMLGNKISFESDLASLNVERQPPEIPPAREGAKTTPRSTHLGRKLAGKLPQAEQPMKIRGRHFHAVGRLADERTISRACCATTLARVECQRVLDESRKSCQSEADLIWATFIQLPFLCGRR